MDALLLDVDDTLYDQLKPFEAAYEDMFADQYRISVEQLFFLSRKYSDEAFEQSQSGNLTTLRLFKSFIAVFSAQKK